MFCSKDERWLVQKTSLYQTQQISQCPTDGRQCYVNYRCISRNIHRVYLNNFPQVAALESRLEVQLFRVGATFAYSVLIPVAQMIVNRCLLVTVTGRHSVEIVDYFLNQAATVKTSFHAREKLRSTDLPVLVVQRLVLAKAIATDQIRVSHLHETDHAFHSARYHAVCLLIRQARTHVAKDFDRRVVIRRLTPCRPIFYRILRERFRFVAGHFRVRRIG